MNAQKLHTIKRFKLTIKNNNNKYNKIKKKEIAIINLHQKIYVFIKKNDINFELLFEFNNKIFNILYFKLIKFRYVYVFVILLYY